MHILISTRGEVWVVTGAGSAAEEDTVRDQDTSEGRADSDTGNTDPGVGADTHTELFISYILCIALSSTQSRLD